MLTFTFEKVVIRFTFNIMNRIIYAKSSVLQNFRVQFYNYSAGGSLFYSLYILVTIIMCHRFKHCLTITLFLSFVHAPFISVLKLTKQNLQKPHKTPLIPQ